MKKTHKNNEKEKTNNNKIYNKITKTTETKNDMAKRSLNQMPLKPQNFHLNV